MYVHWFSLHSIYSIQVNPQLSVLNIYVYGIFHNLFQHLYTSSIRLFNLLLNILLFLQTWLLNEKKTCYSIIWSAVHKL